MSIRDEVRRIVESKSAGSMLLADDLVREAKDAQAYPKLHEHLWGVSETVLAHEARISRAHRLLISVRIVTEEGDNTRLLVHTPGIAGYQPAARVLSNPDLAALKLRQLAADVARSRGRLNEFKQMLPSDVAEAIDKSIVDTERKITDAIETRTAAA